MGALVSMRKGRWSKKRTAEEEGREVFNTTILCHVPVVQYDYWPKCVYLAYMTREVLRCIFDHSLLSDKDYYGNKRIEMSGDLISLLFEDLFKMYNAKIKESVNKSLQKVGLLALSYADLARERLRRRPRHAAVPRHHHQRLRQRHQVRKLGPQAFPYRPQGRRRGSFAVHR